MMKDFNVPIAEIDLGTQDPTGDIRSVVIHVPCNPWRALKSAGKPTKIAACDR
jgi:hypothetical protein